MFFFFSFFLQLLLIPVTTKKSHNTVCASGSKGLGPVANGTGSQWWNSSIILRMSHTMSGKKVFTHTKYLFCWCLSWPLSCHNSTQFTLLLLCERKHFFFSFSHRDSKESNFWVIPWHVVRRHILIWLCFFFVKSTFLLLLLNPNFLLSGQQTGRSLQRWGRTVLDQVFISIADVWSRYF